MKSPTYMLSVGQLNSSTWGCELWYLNLVINLKVFLLKTTICISKKTERKAAKIIWNTKVNERN